MASENETVMDVCAEWRDCIESADPSVWNDERIAGLVKTTKAQQIAYLDRIEAAWKRERVGNAAAMRKALDNIVSLLRSDTFVILNQHAVEIFAKILLIAEAALEYPHRNCDMFGGDAKLLHTAWYDWTGSPRGHNDDGTVKLTFGEWLLVKADRKGGAE